MHLLSLVLLLLLVSAPPAGAETALGIAAKAAEASRARRALPALPRVTALPPPARERLFGRVEGNGGCSADKRTAAVVVGFEGGPDAIVVGLCIPLRRGGSPAAAASSICSAIAPLCRLDAQVRRDAVVAASVLIAVSDIRAVDAGALVPPPLLLPGVGAARGDGALWLPTLRLGGPNAEPSQLVLSRLDLHDSLLEWSTRAKLSLSAFRQLASFLIRPPGDTASQDWRAAASDATSPAVRLQQRLMKVRTTLGGTDERVIFVDSASVIPSVRAYCVTFQWTDAACVAAMHDAVLGVRDKLHRILDVGGHKSLQEDLSLQDEYDASTFLSCAGFGGGGGAQPVVRKELQVQPVGDLCWAGNSDCVSVYTVSGNLARSVASALAQRLAPLISCEWKSQTAGAVLGPLLVPAPEVRSELGVVVATSGGSKTERPKPVSLMSITASGISAASKDSAGMVPITVRIGASRLARHSARVVAAAARLLFPAPDYRVELVVDPLANGIPPHCLYAYVQSSMDGLCSQGDGFCLHKLDEDAAVSNGHTARVVTISETVNTTAFMRSKRPVLLIDTKLASSGLLPDWSSAASEAGSGTIYLPFAALSFTERAMPVDLLDTPPAVGKPRDRKFCAYLFSACEGKERLLRERFFDLLSEHHSVTPLGKCCGMSAINSDGSSHCSTQRASDGGTSLSGRHAASYLDDAVRTFRSYRFVVVFENERVDGYVTEKLVNALMAGAVPIYLGDFRGTASEIFNRDAFIDCGEFPTLRACANFVAAVDQDEQRYNRYVSAEKLRLPLSASRSPFSWIRADRGSGTSDVLDAVASLLLQQREQLRLSMIPEAGDSPSEIAAAPTSRPEPGAREGQAVLLAFAEGCCKRSLEIARETAATRAGLAMSKLFSLEDVREDTEFFERHREILLGEARGAGLWLWKPWLLNRELARCTRGDVLFYADATSIFERRVDDLLNLARDSHVVTFEISEDEHTDAVWTKHDALALMGAAANETLLHTRQRLGSPVICHCDDTARAFVSQWLRMASDRRALDDSPSVLGPERREFREHRHDQSILSVLAKQWGFPALPDPSQWGDATRSGASRYLFLSRAKDTASADAIFAALTAET